MDTRQAYGKQFIYLTSIWLVICLVSAVQLLVTEYRYPDIHAWSQVIWYPITNFVSGVFFIAILVIPGYNWIEHKGIFPKIGWLFANAALFCVAYVYLTEWLRRTVITEVEYAPIRFVLEEQLLSNGHRILVYYLMFIATLTSLGYLRDKLDEIRSRAELEKQLTSTKLIVLKNQLQPHFLFNALNSISSIIDEKKEVAQDMIADLSHLLRASLNTDYGQKVPLHQEIGILNAYVSIEQKRFENQLSVFVNVADEVSHLRTLPFVLLPLVENAVKHGFTAGVKVLRVNVDIGAVGEDFKIAVANNGAALKPGATKGVGLKNLCERLRNEYGQKANFTLGQAGDWVIGEIKIKH